MARAHRMSIAGGVIVCLLSTQGSAMLFASDATTAATQTQSQPAPLMFDGVLVTTSPLVSSVPAGQPLFKPMPQEFSGPMGRNQIVFGDGSIAAAEMLEDLRLRFADKTARGHAGIGGGEQRERTMLASQI